MLDFARGRPSIRNHRPPRSRSGRAGKIMRHSQDEILQADPPREQNPRILPRDILMHVADIRAAWLARATSRTNHAVLTSGFRNPLTSTTSHYMQMHVHAVRAREFAFLFSRVARTFNPPAFRVAQPLSNIRDVSGHSAWSARSDSTPEVADNSSVGSDACTCARMRVYAYKMLFRRVEL